MPENPLPPDAGLKLVSHPRRRTALRCLQSYDTPLTLPDLADEVATAEYDRPLPDISATAVKRIYMALYHQHIPQLTEYDLVRYDQETDTVAPTDRIHAVESYLDLVSTIQAAERSR